jgi:dTDP-4-amino-4,6-dideoxygalactose transaminase
MTGNHRQSRDYGDLPALEGGTPFRSMEDAIVFGAPIIGEAEIAAVTECLRSRWIGLGPRVVRFEEEFARYKGAPFAAAVSSCSAALHLALLALEIGPGDEVIAPAMTFCSTIHAIIHTGARPVLVDCDAATFNIDPSGIESKVNARTKAILAVHMGGRCCDMNPIMAIARRHNLRVIEDCAHAIEAHYHAQPSGLMGDAGCFSFYATKNVTTGDGGMVIAKDEAVIRRVKVLSLHGMDTDAWSRSVRHSYGYQVAYLGFKYNMTDMSAAMGSVQLAQVEPRWLLRERLWVEYTEQLGDLPVVLPAPPESGTRHAYHLFSIVLKPGVLAVGRDTVLAALYAENIGAGIHYEPVHKQPYYQQQFGWLPGDFPHASHIGENTLSLPLAADLTPRDVTGVCDALRRIVTYYSSHPSAHFPGSAPLAEPAGIASGGSKEASARE